MKKIFVTLGISSLVALAVGCGEKRCACVTVRGSSTYEAHSLEPLGNHASCEELNSEWISVIDSATMLSKDCVPE